MTWSTCALLRGPRAMTEDAAEPLAGPKPTPSLADRLCSSVLSIARAEDDGACITSVAKWEHDDSTLLRVSADASTMPSIAAALRRRLPLASVGIVEDVMNGTQQAQLLVPSNADQLRRANAMATESRGVGRWPRARLVCRAWWRRGRTRRRRHESWCWQMRVRTQAKPRVPHWQHRHRPRRLLL